MTDVVTKTASDADEAAMRSIAGAMRDAATTTSQHPAQGTQVASAPGPKALETISQMFYTASYVLAYGVVYATVFVAQSLPQENSVMGHVRQAGVDSGL